MNPNISLPASIALKGLDPLEAFLIALMEDVVTEDEALRIVVPLSREDRKELLQVLVNEMHSADLEEVMAENGFVAE